MPAKNITHESWCQAHEADAHTEYCVTKSIPFGEHGVIWASQSGDEDAPLLFISHAWQDIGMAFEHLLPLRRALDDILAQLGVEVIA